MNLADKIFGEGVYTPRQAARLVRRSPVDVVRWTRGSGPSDPVWQAHYQFLDDGREISFHDLIEVLVISALRKVGVSLQDIRFARNLAFDRFEIDHPFASKKFETDGNELLMESLDNDDGYMSLSKSRPGQKVFGEIVKRTFIGLEFDKSHVARWRPATDVVIDPKRSFGEAILEQSGVSTNTLFQERRAGRSLKDISSLYEIPQSEVANAISFEAQLEEAA